MSLQYNEDLDPNEGPSFIEFLVLAILFAVILLLIPVGVFAFAWPVWLLAILLIIDLVLLFLVSMTSVFLLRVFFADRRRGRGRSLGAAHAAPLVVDTDVEPSASGSEADPPTSETAPGREGAS